MKSIALRVFSFGPPNIQARSGLAPSHFWRTPTIPSMRATGSGTSGTSCSRSIFTRRQTRQRIFLLSNSRHESSKSPRTGVNIAATRPSATAGALRRKHLQAMHAMIPPGICCAGFTSIRHLKLSEVFFPAHQSLLSFSSDCLA